MPFPLFSDFESFYSVIFDSQLHSFICLALMLLHWVSVKLQMYMQKTEADKQTEKREWEIDRYKSTKILTKKTTKIRFRCHRKAFDLWFSVKNDSIRAIGSCIYPPSSFPFARHHASHAHTHIIFGRLCAAIYCLRASVCLFIFFNENGYQLIVSHLSETTKYALKKINTNEKKMIFELQRTKSMIVNFAFKKKIDSRLLLDVNCSCALCKQYSKKRLPQNCWR